MLSGVIPRLILPRVREAIAAGPVVAITGPRTAGKSTLAATLAAEHGSPVVDLDDPATRSLAEADPEAFLDLGPEPLFLDEFQRVPALLAGIKASLNRDRRPGRFVLTGSARHDAVPDLGDFLTGRVDLVTLWPFAQAELTEAPPTPLADRLFGDTPHRATTTMRRNDVVAAVIRGGYPIAVGLAPPARRRWFANLAQLVIERISDDVRTIRRSNSPARVLRLAAGRTGQLLNHAELGRDAGLGRDQTAEYINLLEAVYLVRRLPAWAPSLAAREAKRPKLHMVDTGLAAHLTGLTQERVSPRDPGAMTGFGHLLESWVVGEVDRQLSWADGFFQLGHFRTGDGVEVDIVVERDDGLVAGLEVKAGTAVGSRDGAGLRLLRDRLGSRFAAGWILYLGPRSGRLDDRITALPLSTLWEG